MWTGHHPDVWHNETFGRAGMVVLVHMMVGWENIFHDYCDLNSLGEALERQAPACPWAVRQTDPIGSFWLSFFFSLAFSTSGCACISDLWFVSGFSSTAAARHCWAFGV